MKRSATRHISIGNPDTRLIRDLLINWVFRIGGLAKIKTPEDETQQYTDKVLKAMKGSINDGVK